ncbi:MAG: molybdopterin oxidoreductase family protein [Acidimicrobiales bacterium]
MDVAVGNVGVEISGRQFPTNNGGLCVKGWTAGELLNHPERLTTPLMRAAACDELQACSWDDALDRVAVEFMRCQERYGRDAVGVFGGGGLTNEKAYLLGKFARVALGTANVDYNGRFCMSSAATASIQAFGMDRGMPFPLVDIAGADTILLVGTNVAETMPPAMQHFAEQQRRGGILVVVDPRWTPTAEGASLHLQVRPGSDLALANGMLHIAIRDGLVDSDFVAARTSGFADVRRVVESYWPDRVERLTGVPVAQMRAAVRALARPVSAVILSGRGPEQQSKGTDTTRAWINLALALGQAGRPFAGFSTLTGQGNGQGGREHGLKADQLPGYRRIDDPAARAHVAAVWGVPASDLPGPGRSAYELLDTMGTDDGVRALLVMGSNPAVSAPSVGHVRERLDALDFLCVSDFFLSETARRAHVVLPSAQWAEEDGTVTNLEGRVILRTAAKPPPTGVQTDIATLNALARRLGCSAGFVGGARAVFDELRRASAGGVADYGGITWERIVAEDGLFWPCPDESHPGTPRLFLDGFATADGRARFSPVTYRPPAEEPDDEFPLWLTTGRAMRHYQSGTQTRRVAALAEAEPSAYVEVHPQTARSLGVAEAQSVRLTTRRGSALVSARLTAAIRLDTLFAPFHWGGDASANLLTNPALDPTSKMPEFKVCAARLEPAFIAPALARTYS